MRIAGWPRQDRVQQPRPSPFPTPSATIATPGQSRETNRSTHISRMTSGSMSSRSSSPLSSLQHTPSRPSRWRAHLDGSGAGGASDAVESIAQTGGLLAAGWAAGRCGRRTDVGWGLDWASDDMAAVCREGSGGRMEEEGRCGEIQLAKLRVYDDGADSEEKEMPPARAPLGLHSAPTQSSSPFFSAADPACSLPPRLFKVKSSTSYTLPILLPQAHRLLP
jgi:hypothetical protein